MTLSRVASAVVGFVVAGEIAVAQQPRDPQRTTAPANAVIAGRVISDEPQPKPLRRVRVTISSTSLGNPRTAITQDDGTFRFDYLPGGAYTVRAVKEPYVPVAHGATRPNRPGTPVVLRDAETRDISLRMPRGGVITGTVTGPDGQPFPGISVTASTYRLIPASGERRLAPAMMTIGGLLAGGVGLTDDRGVYRLFGLPPGEYVLSVRPAAGDPRPIEIRLPTNPPRSVSYSTVYYPGTTIASQAGTVTLAKGEERAGIDIPIEYVATARVAGSVSSAFPVAAGQTVTLMLMANQPGADVGTRMSQTSNVDGNFAFVGVPPGPYNVVARSTVRPPTPGGPPTFLNASMEVNVHGEDITNLMLTLQTGLTLSGKVAFEGGAPPAIDFTKLRVNLPLAFSAAGQIVAVPPPRFDASGQFTIEGLFPGTLRIPGTVQGIRSPIGRWWLKSIDIEGVDVLERPLELKQSTNTALVTLSDRASSLSGSVRAADGSTGADAVVVAFSADERSWFVNSKRVGAVKVGPDGRYVIRNLPAGDYFVIATHDMEQGEWFEPAVLRRLVPTAVRLTMGEHEEKTLDVAVR